METSKTLAPQQSAMLGLYGERGLPASPKLTGSEVALGSVIRKNVDV